MVKSIVIDDHANKLLENLLDKKVSFANTGLIIGTIDESRDYILYVIPTPPSPDSPASPEKALSAQKCDWVVNHGLQVHDMLVGGVDILGVYCTDLSPASGKQILLQLFKSLEEIEYYKKMKFNKDRLLFLVDTTTKNINMKSLNFSDTKAALQACQIEAKSGLFDNEFFQLNTYLNLSSIFKTPNVKSYNLVKKDFYSALSVDDLLSTEKFVCLIDNVLIDDKCSFAQYLNSLPQNEPVKQFEATLMENLTMKQRPGKKPTDNGLESIYKLNGVCSLVVLFHKSTSIGSLKRLLVYDLMRSFYARVSLLVEDLDARKDIIGDEELDDPDSDEASAIEESYQTPNRIQIQLQRCQSEEEESRRGKRGELSFLICDYVFPDETNLDISERIRELFNYDLKETQIYFAENLPPEIKRNQDDIDSMTSDDGSNTSGKLVESNVSQSSTVGAGLFSKVNLCVSGLVAGLSALAVYYFSMQEAVSGR